MTKATREIPAENADMARAGLPDGWRWVKLGDVCEVNPPRSRNFKRADDAVTTFVPMSAVDEARGAIAHAQTRLFAEVRRGYTFFVEGDVLFAKITPCMQNGKHAIARGLIGGVGFGTTEFHVLRPKAAVTPEWVHWFLRQPRVLRIAEASFTGTAGQQRVPEQALAEMAVPLPPLAEQKRIAGILEGQMAAVERARAGAAAQLQAAEQLPAAYLRAVFGSGRTEPPAGWRWVKLGDVLCSLETGSRPPGGAMGILEGIPSISAEHMTRHGGFDFSSLRYVPTEFYQQMKRGHIHRGDILVVKDGATTGKVAFVDEYFPYRQAVVNEHVFLCRVAPGIADPRYLFFWLWGTEGQRAVRSHFQGAAIGGINQRFAETVEAPLPPLAEQKRIAEILKEQMAATEQLRRALAEQLETINKLPAALLREAFSGRL